jgi:hypothetical protein
MKLIRMRFLPETDAVSYAFGMAYAASAQTRTLRIVTYNIEDDTGGYTAPRPGLITPSGGGTVQQGGVLEGIGEEILGGDAALPLDTCRSERRETRTGIRPPATRQPRRALTGALTRSSTPRRNQPPAWITGMTCR